MSPAQSRSKACAHRAKRLLCCMQDGPRVQQSSVCRSERLHEQGGQQPVWNRLHGLAAHDDARFWLQPGLNVCCCDSEHGRCRQHDCVSFPPGSLPPHLGGICRLTYLSRPDCLRTTSAVTTTATSGSTTTTGGTIISAGGRQGATPPSSASSTAQPTGGAASTYASKQGSIAAGLLVGAVGILAVVAL